MYTIKQILSRAFDRLAICFIIVKVVDKGYRVWYVTQYMETTHVETVRTKGAALNSLAIVGFVALIIIGILATIYAASFIPKLFTQSGTNGTASAYLSGLSDGSTNTATVTTASTTETTTQNTTVTATPLTPTEPETTPTPVTKTVIKYVTVPSATPSASYSGLSDLTVTITDKGYLQNGVSSFVSSSYVPQGYQGAVRYRISNTGTNTSGSYRVDIRVETNSGTDNDSVVGNSLVPGRSVEGTGSFDATSGGTATIRLTVDALNAVSESNENNNTDSTSISISGYGTNGYSNSTTINTRNTSSYDSNGSYCQYGTYYSNSRYFCNTAQSNTTYGNATYDSNGSYCTYGTYQQSGRYICRPYGNTSSSNINNSYDSNGNYCSYGVYESGNRFYCNSSNSNTNVYYNNRDSGCLYGSYQQNGTYYCY